MRNFEMFYFQMVGVVWFGCVGPRFRDPVMRYPIFQGFSPLAQGRLKPFSKGFPTPDCFG